MDVVWCILCRPKAPYAWFRCFLFLAVLTKARTVTIPIHRDAIFRRLKTYFLTRPCGTHAVGIVHKILKSSFQKIILRETKVLSPILGISQWVQDVHHTCLHWMPTGQNFSRLHWTILFPTANSTRHYLTLCHCLPCIIGNHLIPWGDAISMKAIWQSEWRYQDQ